MARFFAETAQGGRWCPAIWYGGKPEPKAIDGRARRFRADPVVVPPFLDGLSLTMVCEFLSPDGQLHDLPSEQQAQVAQFLKTPTSGEIVVRV